MVSSTLSAAVAAATNATATHVAAQGGILEGSNPTVYDKTQPIVLFIIQAGIILVFCRLLHYPLSLLRQPRVIAEVIGGILLGPSVFGRIPHFTATIFPAAAMPNLSLVANLGLILFLFLVGLEVDVRFLASNWRIALSVGIGGMALPFGLGCTIAWGLYHQFGHEPGTVPISFGVFMLFVGVAMAITAFPVLCRILTELKLLNTPVGIIVLSAGVGNDVVGWILLALCVALVNAGTGLTALWVLLTCIGYTLFLIFAVRPVFLHILNRSRSLQDGPSQGIVALTLLLALSSAFFTGVIGVHPIFGAFLVGIICPHDGGFAIKVTEKLEDLISALFLPLYFASSGLSTNLGLLDSGIVWAYVIGIISVAFCGKFIGAAVAARISGMVWRESFAIGSLMSCKGLVELIVLNIGLQAKILSSQTFTMFVVMALVTTFATTPLTHTLYPPTYQRKIEAWKRGEIDWDTGRLLNEDDPPSVPSSIAKATLESNTTHRMLIYLRLDNMPAILAFMSLFRDPGATESQIHPANRKEEEEMVATESKVVAKQGISAHAVRLIGLTERNSSVMQVSEVDEYALHDPLVNTFRTFGQLYNIPTSGEVDVVPEAGFADALINRASDQEADLLLLPWSETGTLSEVDFTGIGSRTSVADGDYARFVLGAVQSATQNAAVFINKTAGSEKKGRPLFRSKSFQSARSAGLNRSDFRPTALLGSGTRHIFCPVFGGPDDMLAIVLVLQMVENGGTATIVRFAISVDDHGDSDDEQDGEILKPKLLHQTTLETSTDGANVDQAVAGIQPHHPDRDTALFESAKARLAPAVLQRVVFETVHVNVASDPVKACVERAATEVGLLPKNAGDMVVVGRNWGLKGISHSQSATGEMVERCLGHVGTGVVRSSVHGGVLVVKAAA